MRIAQWFSVTILLFFVTALPALAHCDTMSGPVVSAARIALKNGDVTPVLRWVQPQVESEVRAAFERTIAVRSKGPEAAALADQWFFETLVRLHRQGEGEPFIALRDEPAEPVLALADAAIAEKSSEQLKKMLIGDLTTSIDVKFRDVLEAKKHADESVDNGRRYVAAYVAFMHAIEAMHATGGETH